MLDRGQMKHDNYLGDDETKSYCDVSKQVWQQEAMGDNIIKIDMVVVCSIQKECKTQISNLKRKGQHNKIDMMVCSFKRNTKYE